MSSHVRSAMRSSMVQMRKRSCSGARNRRLRGPSRWTCCRVVPGRRDGGIEVRALRDLLFRRRRLDRYEQLQMQKRLDAIRKTNQTSRDMENLRGHVSEFNEAKTLEQVEAMLSLLSPLYRNTIRRRWPLREGDDPNTWGPRIASGLSAWIPPVRHEEADEFIEVVDLPSFDQHLAYPASGRHDRPDHQALDTAEVNEADVSSA